VAWIADKMTGFWGEGAMWILDPDPGVHEAGTLKLDTSRARADLGWTPRLHLQTSIEWIVQWTRAWQAGGDMHTFTLGQIEAYESLLKG
jgi:CDP-glucose 4,6-dehydratase